MTTVAYNHKDKELAFDSRICADNHIISDDFDKSVKVGGDTFIFAGATCHYKLFAENFDDGKACEFDYKCHGLMVRDGKCYSVALEDGVFIMDELTYNDTIGSGSCYAMSALDFGKSAKEAIDYASTRCSATGGTVRVIKVGA